jgi:hypothetical protein
MRQRAGGTKLHAVSLSLRLAVALFTFPPKYDLIIFTLYEFKLSVLQNYRG